MNMCLVRNWLMKREKYFNRTNTFFVFKVKKSSCLQCAQGGVAKENKASKEIKVKMMKYVNLTI